MPDLRLIIEDAQVAPHSATPLLLFKLRIQNEPANENIHAIVLRAQIQIEATRRKYDANEQAQLKDLFGEPHRWGQTLRSLLWTHASIVVPRFTGETHIDLPVHCSFDFNVAATKYFHGLTAGELPLCFQFSGTVFYEALVAPASSRLPESILQVAPISWDKEAKYRLPVRLWKDLMNEHYPNSAWLLLRKDTFERLHQFKIREGIPTWDEVFERALNALSETVRS